MVQKKICNTKKSARLSHPQESENRAGKASSKQSAKKKSAEKTKQASGDSNFSAKVVSKINPTCGSES